MPAKKDDDDDMKSKKDDEDTYGDSMKEEEEDAVPRMDKKRKDSEGKAEKPAGLTNFKHDDDDEEAKMDEDDMKAKMDDEEEMKKADAQAKADSVYSAFGKQASRPLLGESLFAYRKRLLRPLQSYSDTYKSVDIVKAVKDSALLDIVEKQIHNDALQSAKLATHIPQGSLYAVKKVDASGRTITSYKGHIGAFLDEFKLEPMRATRWFTNNVERN
jgi:hypothetical protein